MDFGEALDEMRKGHKVERIGWNGRNMHIAISDGGTARFHPAGASPSKTVMLGAFIVMQTATGEYVRWSADDADLLALDWARLVK